MAKGKTSRNIEQLGKTPQERFFKAADWFCHAIVDTIGDPTEPHPLMAQRLDIKVPYPGSCLSVNHYKYYRSGLRRTKTETRHWMEQFIALIQPKLLIHTKEFESATITLEGYFKDKRSPDLANLHKVIGDALQEAICLNDKYFDFVDKGCQFGCVKPFLSMVIMIKLKRK